MAFGTRVWGAGKILALVGALAATFLLFAAASMRVALRSREVTVPDLTGKGTSDATAVAGALGLTLHVDEARRVDPRVPADRVLAQEPTAGTATRRPRSVHVWLSSGPRAAKIPSLVGDSERAATSRIAQSGLTLAGIAELRSPSYPADVVVAQDPEPRAAAGEVALLVNRSAAGDTYVMPDLVGANGERAAAILRAHGFRVAIVGAVTASGIASGGVVRHNPQAGFQIATDDPISLEVSK